MGRVIDLATARCDLRRLVHSLTEASGSANVSRKFILRIRASCDRVSSLPFEMSRERPELDPNLRSTVFENDGIFCRHTENCFEVINILKGHRDIQRFLAK